MQNYYEKFIKYKSKYLKLLKQLEMKGGAGEQSLTKYINADETRVTVQQAREIIESTRLLESEINDTIVEEEERKTVKNTDQFYDALDIFENYDKNIDHLQELINNSECRNSNYFNSKYERLDILLKNMSYLSNLKKNYSTNRKEKIMNEINNKLSILRDKNLNKDYGNNQKPEFVKEIDTIFLEIDALFLLYRTNLKNNNLLFELNKYKSYQKISNEEPSKVDFLNFLIKKLNLFIDEKILADDVNKSIALVKLMIKNLACDTKINFYQFKQLDFTNSFYDNNNEIYDYNLQFKDNNLNSINGKNFKNQKDYKIELNKVYDKVIEFVKEKNEYFEKNIIKTNDKINEFSFDNDIEKLKKQLNENKISLKDEKINEFNYDTIIKEIFNSFERIYNPDYKNNENQVIKIIPILMNELKKENNELNQILVDNFKFISDGINKFIDLLKDIVIQVIEIVLFIPNDNDEFQGYDRYFEYLELLKKEKIRLIRHFDKEIFSEKYYYWYLYQFNILDGKDNEQFFKFFLIRLFINGENSVNMSINNFFGIFGTKSEKLDSVDELRKIQKFNLVGVEDKIREITNYNDYIKIIQEEIKLVGITDNATAEIILKYFEYDKENDKDFLFNFRNKFFKIYEATAVKQNFLDQKIKSYQNYSFISNLKVVNDLYKNTYPILKESIFEDISEKIKYFFEVYVNEFDPFQFSVEIDNYDECCSKLEEVIRISNLNGIEFEVLAYLKEINKINLKLDTNDHQKIFDLAKDKIDTFDNEFFEKNLRKKIGCTDINRKNTSDFLLAFIKSKYDNIDKKQNMGDIIFENIKNYICNELYNEPIKIDGNNIGIDDEPITVEDISNAIFSDNVNLTALKSYIETKSLGHINRYNLFQISFSDDQLPELNKKRNDNLFKLREFIDQYINNNSNEDDIRNALNIIKAYFYVYDEGIYQNYYNSNLIGGEGHNNYVNDLEPSFNDFKSLGYLYGEDLDLGSFLDEINKYSFNDPLDLLVEIIKYEFLKISNRNNKEYPKDILEKFIFGKYDKHISNFFDQNPHNMHLPYHTVKEELFFVRFVKLNHVIDTFVAEGKFNSIDRNDIIDILLELKDVLDYYEKEDIWLDIDDIYTHLVNAFDYYYNGSNKDKGLVDLINQKYNITSESESSQSKIINRRPQFKFLKKLKENEKMVYYLINLLKDMNIIKDPECLLRLLFSKSYIIYGKGFLLGEKSKPIIPYYHEELVDDHKFSKLVTSNDFSLSKFISILDKFINPGNPDSNDKTKTPLFIMKNYLNSIQVGNYRFNSKIKLFNKDKEKLYKEYQNHIELIKYHESNINDLDAKSNIKSKLADNKQIKKSKVMYIGVENYLDYFYSLNFKNSEELGKLLVEVNGTKKENEFDFKFLRYDNYYRYSQQLQKVCYNLYRLERESIGMTIDIDWYDENTKKMFIDYYKTKLRRNELFDIIPKKDDEVDFFNAKKEELIKRYETYIEIYNNIIVVLDNILLIEEIDFNNNENYDDLIRKFSEYYQNINKNIESFESIIIEKEEEYRKKYTKDENEKIKEDIFKLINDYLIYSGKIDISKLIQEYEEAQSLLKFNVTVNNDLISEISQKHSTDFPNENTFGTIYKYLKNKDDTRIN